MLGVGGILAEAVADVVFRPAPVDAVTAHEMIDQLATQRLLGVVPRRGTRRPRRPGRDPRRPRAARRRAARRRQRRRQPADRHAGRHADRRRRPRRAARRRPTADAGPLGRPPADGRAVPRPVRAARRARRRRLDAPRQVRVRVAAQPARQRLRGRRLRHQPAGRGGARHPDRRRRRRAARRRDRPRLRVHAGVRQPGAAAGLRGEGHPGRVPHVGRLRRGRRGRPPGRGRAGGPRRRARHPARRAQRPGRRQHAGRACAPRSSPRTRRPGASAWPARAATSCPASSTTPGRPASGSAGPCRPATPPPCRSPTTSTTTPTTTATAVGLAYVEGIADGRSLLDRLAAAAARKPLVLVKGGATEGGARAAASHTGALAADDKVFDGECRAAGITRAATVEEAFEAAATFATQPAPAGPNVVVLTTAGGWGVVTPTPSPATATSGCSPCPTTCATPSTGCCRRAGAATTRSTAPAARRATRSPT